MSRLRVFSESDPGTPSVNQSVPSGPTLPRIRAAIASARQASSEL